MKFYGMVGYDLWTNRLDFEWPWPKFKVTRSQKVKVIYANNYVQHCHRESLQNLQRSLFNSLNISKYDYGVQLTVSNIDRGQNSDGSGHNEIDYNSLNTHFRTTPWVKTETL